MSPPHGGGISDIQYKQVKLSSPGDPASTSDIKTAGTVTRNSFGAAGVLSILTSSRSYYYGDPNTSTFDLRNFTFGYQTYNVETVTGTQLLILRASNSGDVINWFNTNVKKITVYKQNDESKYFTVKPSGKMTGNAITIRVNLDMDSWINHTGESSLSNFLYNNRTGVHVIMSGTW